MPKTYNTRSMQAARQHLTRHASKHNLVKNWSIRTRSQAPSVATHRPHSSLSDRKAKRISSIINWNEWVSATKLRNYFLKDPLLDWLKYYSAGEKHMSAGLVPTKKTTDYSFTNFIMQKGIQFEEVVINYLKQRFPAEIATIATTVEDARSHRKYLETCQAIKSGTPIIYQGVLHNYDNSTFGMPDLIVRSDWLNKLVPCTLTDEEVVTSAPNLEPTTTNESPAYHYVIVDIKFSTLKLRSNGKSLLNAASYPAYKAQLCVYNKALTQIQGYDPGYAFVLGRKWHFERTKNRVKLEFSGDSCFEKLGRVEFTGFDKSYTTEIEKAVQWIKDLRKDGNKWDLYPKPSRPELYPNMCNHQDGEWRIAKKRIADRLREITQLWCCGVNHRQTAHSHQVYSWDDPRCTTETLGITGEKRKAILDASLDLLHEANNPHQKTSYSGVWPTCITNNWKDWQNPKPLELYIDFETVNDLNDDFTSFPKTMKETIIYMVGMGWLDKNNVWQYRHFSVKNLSVAEEEIMINEWFAAMRTLAAEYNTTAQNVPCFHWGSAERSFFDRCRERHAARSPHWHKIHWLNMLKVVKDEPVVVKGSFGFGLKEYSQALKQLGHIQSGWDSEFSDGMDAMVGVWKINQTAKDFGTDLVDVPSYGEIVKYNEIDCKVVMEIVQFLRTRATTQ